MVDRPPISALLTVFAPRPEHILLLRKICWHSWWHWWPPTCDSLRSSDFCWRIWPPEFMMDKCWATWETFTGLASQQPNWKGRSSGTSQLTGLQTLSFHHFIPGDKSIFDFFDRWGFSWLTLEDDIMFAALTEQPTKLKNNKEKTYRQ